MPYRFIGVVARAQERERGREKEREKERSRWCDACRCASVSIQFRGENIAGRRRVGERIGRFVSEREFSTRWDERAIGT